MSRVEKGGEGETGFFFFQLSSVKIEAINHPWGTRYNTDDASFNLRNEKENVFMGEKKKFVCDYINVKIGFFQPTNQVRLIKKKMLLLLVHRRYSFVETDDEKSKCARL